MGIFTICFREHKYKKILNKNTLSHFCGVILAVPAIPFPIQDDFGVFYFARFSTLIKKSFFLEWKKVRLPVCSQELVTRSFRGSFLNLMRPD